MSTLYEVWDYETGNCIGAYPDRGAALADVRATVRAHGLPAAASLVLLTAPDDGDGERIAAGKDLVQLAEADAPPLPASTTLAVPPPTTRHTPAPGRYTHGTWRNSRKSPARQSGKSSAVQKGGRTWRTQKSGRSLPASPFKGVRQDSGEKKGPKEK